MSTDSLQLRGIIPILQTPFKADGSIDYDSLIREVEFCIRCRVHGVVIPANASEFFALSDSERKEVVKTVAYAVRGEIPVIASVSGLTSWHARDFAINAIENGVDALMAMPPYLRKTSEFYEYYHAIARIEPNCPIIIQNAPPPLGTPIPQRSIQEIIAGLPSVQYVKEETPPTGQKITRLLTCDTLPVQGVFSGANGVWLTFDLERGVTGCMPAAGVADIQVRIYESFRAGRHREANLLQSRLYRYLTLTQLYGVTTVKEVLRQRGIISDGFVRDPSAAKLDQYDQRLLKEIMNDLGEITLI